MTTATKQAANLPELVEYAAQNWPQRVAMHFDPEGTVITFAELAGAVRGAAAGLRELGIGPGDRVALLLPNVVEFPIAWLATTRLGAAMVPVNVYLGESDLRSLLVDARPSAIIVSTESAGKLAPLLAELGQPQVVLVGAGEQDEVSGTRWERLTSASGQPERRVFPEAVANIQYTSGSTGTPKGCLLSHAYWMELAQVLIDHGPRLTGADVLLTAQPFYYMDPQWNLVGALHTGAKLVVLDRFHPRSFWESVRRHRVTFFYCLGVMPTLLLKTEPSGQERDNLVRYIACSALPTDRHRELEERFGAPWHELYGSTELGLVTMVEPAEHDATVGTGALGRPMPNLEVRIVDDSGQPVPRGSVGNLLVRGARVTYGYFGDDAATEAAFRGGWYDTGDLVHQDEADLLYFHGRTKDIIRRSGENIAAVQLESVLEQHAEVALAACVPVPDELRGEEIQAFVVARGSRPAAELVPELIEFAQRNLAYFKVPRYWVLRDRLPLTASEKIAKKELREAAAGRQDPGYDRVSQLWFG
ncbi:crotonobetaine/carnitine-CoA ligase [Tamaricihabitans halophyticus]|uniref:Crotonobetaine/carnitine-CoA ligase n=1 Tax=Tamaricihabitans halophyticus TaxID=1262583 RepID=A0A4V2SUE7_9PSEU|nr:AMP-binding protein [Tamaricihabitans halophyticus]TCP54236.1 crotonobetaine/carnitine-CoA ligase [Tamaricihabitans halophyticus]